MVIRKTDKFKLMIFILSTFLPAISHAEFVDDLISIHETLLWPFQVTSESICRSFEPCQYGVGGTGYAATSVPFTLITTGLTTIDISHTLYNRLAMAKEDSLQYLATDGTYVTSNLDGAVAAYQAEDSSVNYRSAVLFIAML
jgi:hypothetical protein